FFGDLATKAPHGPYNVPDKYADPYRKQGLTDTMSRFYGMIENIDENLGVLLAKLDEWHLRDNTILIFMSDNGSAAGMQGNKKWPGYNADMRGTKGSEYEGGHRVPCFIQWPAGGIGDPRKENSGRDEDYLSAHFDLQPTIEELCDVMHPDGPPRDGISLATRIRNPVAPMPDRTLFVHSQRVAHPIEWRKCSVMTQQWRLVNGDQLYEIHKDPGETNNLAKDNPDEVAKLRQAYIDWWKTLEPVFGDYVRAGVGSDKQNPVEFMSHDWLVEDQRDSPWAQELVKRGLMTSGPWAIDVLRDGKYEVTLSRWPLHLNQSAEAVHAKLTIGGQTVEKDVTLADTSVKFTLTLPKGPAMMQSWLTTPEGKVRGAYFATVKRVE
ncbi:MAG: sulfatase-like hydrolase/transferase, partial [Planctomycetes bacterium]|nr:sulfatase-like hydrolase/transferase [Planctomycetota bacterium]